MLFVVVVFSGPYLIMQLALKTQHSTCLALTKCVVGTSYKTTVSKAALFIHFQMSASRPGFTRAFLWLFIE